MKRVTTLSTIILTILIIGTGKAYCEDTTNPYLSTKGGTYKLLTQLSDYHQDNILLFASMVTLGEQPAINIMSSASTSFGYFNSYDYGEYSSMPDCITLTNVNGSSSTDGSSIYYPYEYIAHTTSSDASTYLVTLQDYDNKYVSTTASSNNSLVLSNATSKTTTTTIKESNNTLTCITYSGKFLKCINTSVYNTYKLFTDITTSANAAYSISYLYKKVHALNIGSTGYATLYYGNHDLIMPSDETLKAYTYKLEDQELTTSHTFEAGSTIPAGTAVVMKGTPNTTYYLDIIASCTTPSNTIFTEWGTSTTAPDGFNLLYGTNTDSITKGSDCRFFYLTNGSTGFGFRYRAAGGAAFKNGAHKAYLCIPESYFSGSQAKSTEFLLPDDDDTPAAINSSCSSETTNNLSNRCYDLSGKRISEPQHGVYIKQGKVQVK